MADRNVKIVKKQGRKPVTDWYAKTASTALDKNSLVEITSGYIAASDDDDTQVFGILRKEIAATDADYASATLVPVDVLYPGDIVEIDTTAALTVGTSYGISNAYTVDQSDTTNDVFTCTESVSSTRARGFFKTYTGDGVVS